MVRGPTNQLERITPMPRRLGGCGGSHDHQQEQSGSTHPRKIGIVLLILLAACGQSNKYVGVGTLASAGTKVNTTPMAATAVWVLGRSGASPPDTAVTFRASEGRTIVMRHGAPDNAIFAILSIPAGAMTARSGDSATISLSPSPGQYGVTLLSTDSLGAGIQLTFSYATHFQEPSEATSKYPTPGQFEQATAPLRVLPSGQVQFVVNERPAADMIRFPVTATGTWLLAAPR